MRIPVYSQDANPAVDSPLFFAKRTRLRFLLDTAQARMISQRTAQMLTAAPSSTLPAPQDFMNAALIDSKTHWVIANQTRKGYGPGMPQWQMAL